MTRQADLSRIKAISFDGDMTLWDFEAVMRHALGHALNLLRTRVPGPASQAMTIDRMIALRDQVASELKDDGVKLEEIRLQAFARTAAVVGNDDPALAEELNRLYLAHRFEDIELYPDVIPVLDKLGPRYMLGLLSNGNGHPERCGLPGRFEFVVFAQDVGRAKPDPTIFFTTCRQAGCDPHELLHVGDSLESDVQGANGVGATSIWLNRKGAPNATEIRPHYEIQSLSEIPDLLGI
jgi:FMN hydrolase / 5-amino-6-(5-phospho-D-ribitylamino)uracil phosphatase